MLERTGTIDAVVAPPSGAGLPDRYEDLGLLGSGGMGEVRQVRDRVLNRTLAMKVLRTPLRPGALARFVEEAQATAQLQHPGIVPVHDFGVLADGRAWFTMKEVQGRTLSEVVRDVHGHADSATEWTLRRALGAFVSVCQAVAYAHERGVLHRDLKPANVMVGRHGEVYVLDWGLAKVRSAHAPSQAGPRPVLTDRAATRSELTHDGTVAGTPAYMPPEQARGEIEAIDERSDIYALGAILYETLSGRPPYEGPGFEVLEAVLTAAPDPLRSGPGGAPLASELIAACERAMARDPRERYASATALGDDVRAWLDGARRRQHALRVTELALSGSDDAATLRERAEQLRAQGRQVLDALPPWAPEADKAPGWTLLSEAEAAEQAAALAELKIDLGLEAALQIAPDLEEAHAALALRHADRHRAAEARRDQGTAAEAETLVAAHVAALPDAHPVGRRLAAYLRGDGALSLVTDPPGAEVVLYRYVAHNRRLVEVRERSLGITPLVDVPLAMGRYLCLLRHPERIEVRYPVEITRQATWNAVAPGAAAPTPIWLPRRGALPDAAVYVPAGWFSCGGDVSDWPEQRVWCDPFLMARFPVTNAEYIAFLDDLVAAGREEAALAFVPRERSGGTDRPGALIYGYADGRFHLRADADGDPWLAQAPVVSIDHEGAAAYHRWVAARTGLPWRLPTEIEWEKAARGVDGRAFPFGDHTDATWARLVESAPDARCPVVVDSYPLDVSPYGVRGLAGNVRDWCLDLLRADPPTRDGRAFAPDDGDADPRALRAIRGGSWASSVTARNVRSTYRNRAELRSRAALVGTRGVVPVPPEPADAEAAFSSSPTT